MSRPYVFELFSINEDPLPNNVVRHVVLISHEADVASYPLTQVSQFLTKNEKVKDFWR
jgi:hypothetical protein